jgi:hypothetical protein
MNARQRKISMTRRHMDWPIGARVVVKTTGAIYRISKHWREHPYSCSVDYVDSKDPRPFTVGRVPFSQLFLIDTMARRKRPWYREFKRQVLNELKKT